MRMTRRAVMAISATTLALPALAQIPWPSRTIRFIVPFAAGGPVEVPARFLADHLGRALGQTVLVETRPGAGGSIGAREVVAANDPHTLLVSTSGVAIAPALMRNPGYDPINDLVPITVISDAPMVIMTRPDHPIRDLADLVARAKARPDGITYGTSGVGSTTHMGGALFATRAGIELLHVPYRGAAQATTALLSGDTDLVVAGTIDALPHLRDGRLRGIGITSGERSAALPNVPSLSEVAPGFDLFIWYAMFGPRGTPPAVVQRLAAEMAPLARGNILATRMEESGAKLLLDGPARLAERMRVEVPQWRDVAARARITAE
ncbi:Bug family tripartite tricarboxylate transporter substrate binding protein [Falsiroseomonas sp.]|jgi:tripartite-type tricarboxylate transporter receptor subunit TctC|uniref:Bug family tripartite tricarboxylate transporter substrate binding protein n=1 Tax=Falsiroseomonas sp. TaxID=2870721 RepID=UPI003F72F81E